MPSALPDSIVIRARQLALGQGLSAAESWRAILTGADGSEPFRCSYGQVRRAIARARSDGMPAAELSVDGMARRILRLLDRQLARIEAAAGSIDLEELDRMARTLRTIEPIRSSSSKTKASSLHQLVRQEPMQGEPIGTVPDHDRNGQG